MIYDLIVSSQKESSDNRKKAIHNLTASIEDMRPYCNDALTELIDSVDNIFKER